MEGIFNFINSNFIQGYIPEVRTPEIQPFFADSTNSPKEKEVEKSNSQIAYYHEAYTNDINASQVQNVLDNQNKENNNKITEVIKADEITNSETSDIPQPHIVNIVSMVDLCIQLNLRKIALKCTNAEYNPKRINAVIMRLKQPKSAALIFNSGKIIVLGAKNEQDSEKAAKIFAHSIKGLGYEPKFKNFQIINIVGTCDVKFDIKLTQLSLHINAKLNNNSEKKICHYEPDIFPGLIYHMASHKLTVLVFSSGKINFVGAKHKNDIYEAYKRIYPLLLRFKKETVAEKNSADEKKE